MRPRVALALRLRRGGPHLRALALGILKPADLVEISRVRNTDGADAWSNASLVDVGLHAYEEAYVDAVGRREGRLLLLGVGGGREAIPLAKMGFDVTGTDFVPELVEATQANAAAQGVEFKGLVQELAELDVAPESFEIVWVSTWLYSYVPTRRRRLQTLARIRDALVPGGHCVCQFGFAAGRQAPRARSRAAMIAAWLTLGNLEYEPGDRLTPDDQFVHEFWCEAAARDEFDAAGFTVQEILVREDGAAAAGILVKPTDN